MNGREWNIFCEYVLLPRIEFLEELAAQAGLSVYRSLNLDGTPVCMLKTDGGEFMLQYEELEIDWEALEELSEDAADLMLRILPQPWTKDVSEKLGTMVIPEESIKDAEDLTLLARLLASGQWSKEAKLPACTEDGQAYCTPRMIALEEALDEEGLEPTNVQNEDGEWPELYVVSGGRVFGFSFLPLEAELSWALRIRCIDKGAGENVSQLFPERGEIRPSEFYEKELGIFEREYFPEEEEG